jgi:hypothetical protein
LPRALARIRLAIAAAVLAAATAAAQTSPDTLVLGVIVLDRRSTTAPPGRP